MDWHRKVNPVTLFTVGLLALLSTTFRVPAQLAAPEEFWSAVLKQALSTALGGLVSLGLLFAFVYKYQRESERQKLLHELSKEFEKIASTECVYNLENNGLKKEVKYIFTVALTRRVPWLSSGKIQYDFSTPDRLLVFTENRGLISSSVLHEALFWFRRVRRARQVRLLKNKDLYQMWRQILPFVTDRRYEFLKSYWGKEDVSVIVDVAGYVLLHCKKKNLKVPLDYLKEPAGFVAPRVDSDFVVDLPKHIRLFVQKETGMASTDVPITP